MKNNTSTLLIFGATGLVGRHLVTEARQRKHHVLAVSRLFSPVTTPSNDIQFLKHDVEKDDRDLLAKIVSRVDWVISALRPAQGEEHKLVTMTSTIIDAARASSTPFIIVGGAASLKVPHLEGHTVLTAPDYLPPAVVPIAKACQAQYESIEGQLEQLGSYICPPAELCEGKRTGSYRTGKDTLITDSNNRSYLSLADFAVALLDEVDSRSHMGQRFTVGY